jgi:hypothetical protein
MATEITGIVERVNERGFTLRERTGWLNVSQYAQIEAPKRGQYVRVRLDGSGFVRAVEPVATTNGHKAAQSAPSRRPDRDVIVTRLAVLNTATAILSSAYRETNGPEVMELAADLEQWATREEGSQ